MAKRLKYAWASHIFKTPELAKEWLPKLEAMREELTPNNYRQSVSKLDLMDYDAEFAKDPDPNIIAAGFENSEGEEISLDDVKKQMFQMSDGSVNYVAACKCGHLRGNYNVGTVCPKCGTKCRNSFADEIKFGGWLVVPETLPPLLHPHAYRVLKKWLGKLFKQPTYILDAILNPEIELPAPYAGMVGQGMDYFVKNFDDVIAFCASQRKGIKAKDNAEIFEFIKEWRHCMFVRHIPILHQSLHVLTQTGTMTYEDESSEFILETYLKLSSIIYAQRHQPNISPVYVQKNVWLIYAAWQQYMDSIIKPKLSGKTGFIRKYVLGARMHASARAVIVPITRNHWADEIELPWRMVVGLFKLEIMNILQNRQGYSINEACELFNQALVTYNPTIDNCLRILHEECPFKGFPILMGRNPKRSLSEQLGPFTRNRLGIIRLIAGKSLDSNALMSSDLASR